MFILLEKTRFGWETPDYLTEIFDSIEEAELFRDENGLINAAIFEFKGFM
jgi:ABC-type proline/glycine betaine transport system substrate-binding protein